MLSNYLIVHKSILPEYYEKVLACRSTYYKYKDYIFEPSDLNSSRKAVFSMMLDHAPGVLSALLACISECGASVLTITQSLPIHNKASVTISIDITDVTESVDSLSGRLSAIPGLDNLRLLAIE